MRRKFFIIFLIFSLLPLFFVSSSNATKKNNNAKKSNSNATKNDNNIGKPDNNAEKNDNATVQLQVNAKSAVLLEVSTGKVLFEENPKLIIEPASFTKMITLYMIFEAIRKGVVNLDDKIGISEQAWRTGGSKMFVEVNSKVPLEELIKGIAVVSGNDACVAVAEHLYGSVDAFVGAMNRKVQELGMASSTFQNPHGLPAEGQITTAGDMAHFALAYLRQFPQSLSYHSMREYTYSNITQSNRNRLLFKDESVDGLKTGYVAAAGYHLAATAQRDGMRLLAVVMGAPSPGVREREAQKLLEYGFRQYALIRPFPDNKPVTALKLWKGVKDTLDVYPVEATTLLVPQFEKKDVRWEVSLPESVEAPIQLNQPLGKVTLYVGSDLRKTINLVSHEEIVQAGWPKRLWHGVLQINSVPWRWIGGVAGGIAVILVVGLFVSSSVRTRSKSRL